VLKLLLLSILLATIVLPIYAARRKDPRQALWTALGAMFLAELGYAFFLFFIYPRLV
jgi:hypothetical protein